MRIESIQVGVPKTVHFRRRAITTAIFKERVEGPVMLKELNLVGDRQADLTVHGGRDKALYAYALDAYPAWRALRPSDELSNGAFGENLSMDALPEDEIGIGDRYALGDAVVQVTQPRLPCYKLGVKFGDPKILAQFMRMRRPGVYFRVLREGEIHLNDALTLLEREPVRVSVADVFGIAAGDDVESDLLEKVLRVKGMPDQWQRVAKTRLGA